ncbi:MAG: hypothetical protein K1X29_06555 [Bdellovibrionales bacterium]|nr:hypothetical protein [Bdellovibrionales bacterium]
MKSNSFCLVLFLIMSLTTCVSSEKKTLQEVIRTESIFDHLSQYKSLNCTVTVQLAEPVKSNWMMVWKESSQDQRSKRKEIKKEKLWFEKMKDFEKTEYIWSTSPYRCEVFPRSQNQSPDKTIAALYQDTENKLKILLCTWMQSFYSDSPLRGWQKGGAKIYETDQGFKLQKGTYQWIEYKNNPLEKLSPIFHAQLGQNISLEAQYILLRGFFLPQTIEYGSQGLHSRLQVVEYESEKLNQKMVPTQIQYFIGAEKSKNEQPIYFSLKISRCEN